MLTSRLFQTPVSLLAVFLFGCAGSQEKKDLVQYSSGKAPITFDLVVSQKSPNHYDIGGSPHDFDALVRRVRDDQAKTVLVKGAATVADVLCVSILGVESGASAFFAPEDGEPKAVTWSMNSESTAKVRKHCRE